MRSHVGRDEQCLGKRGDIEYVRYRPHGLSSGDGDSRWDLYDACVEIGGTGEQGPAAHGATRSDSGVPAYLRDAHAAAVKLGMVDVNVLKINGEAVAFDYNYVCDGNLIGVGRGHVHEFSRDGVEDVLFLKMLRSSFQRQDRGLDVGPGSIGFKRCWSNHMADSYRYVHYPILAPRIQLLRLARWAQRNRSILRARPLRTAG